MEVLNSKRLTECRLRLGITKQEAAKRIQISQPAYLRYEAGTRNPSIQIISKMAEVFSTSADYLIGKTELPISDKITISRNESPSLFLLAEKCKDMNESQIERLISYVNTLADEKDAK